MLGVFGFHEDDVDWRTSINIVATDRLTYMV